MKDVKSSRLSGKPRLLHGSPSCLTSSPTAAEDAIWLSSTASFYSSSSIIILCQLLHPPMSRLKNVLAKSSLTLFFFLPQTNLVGYKKRGKARGLSYLLLLELLLQFLGLFLQRTVFLLQSFNLSWSNGSQLLIS